MILAYLWLVYKEQLKIIMTTIQPKIITETILHNRNLVRYVIRRY